MFSTSHHQHNVKKNIPVVKTWRIGIRSADALRVGMADRPCWCNCRSPSNHNWKCHWTSTCLEFKGHTRTKIQHLFPILTPPSCNNSKRWETYSFTHLIRPLCDFIVDVVQSSSFIYMCTYFPGHVHHQRSLLKGQNKVKWHHTSIKKSSLVPPCNFFLLRS